MRAAPEDLAAVPGIGPQTAKAIRTFDDWEAVARQLSDARAVGAKMLPVWSAGYPAPLREIYDPPAFLWVRGTLTDADRRAVAIVGTRRATDYGKRLAFQLAGELARHGVTVVSGLAYGIDAAAHRGALEAGGRTLAVLGSGIDVIYPSRNGPLAADMMTQGAVLSEYALGAKPDAANFPRRNRIVSGLSLGVVVVEAYQTGGALITARLAIEQNREVFAFPSSVHSKAGVGANHLIQRGHARLILSAEDVLEELNLAPESSGEEPPSSASGQAARGLPPAAAAEMHPHERALYEALGPEPTHIDELCQCVDLDVSSALVHLLNLEFEGRIRQLAGKQFYRIT